ncbi:MAG: helix-turn-helix transcriptional regulator [Chlorobi bacterium]|nr:helix-turn-helix transcriptional regulator [Chlorobiota bacterium]
MKNLKDVIREARLEQGVVLRKVASATEIDQTIINKFELGERKPSREQVEKLAAFYGLDKDELIITWKSDLVYNDLKDEKLANQILKVAEQKIEYFNSKH